MVRLNILKMMKPFPNFFHFRLLFKKRACFGVILTTSLAYGRAERIPVPFPGLLFGLESALCPFNYQLFQ